MLLATKPESKQRRNLLYRIDQHDETRLINEVEERVEAYDVKDLQHRPFAELIKLANEILENSNFNDMGLIY